MERIYQQGFPCDEQPILIDKMKGSSGLYRRRFFGFPIGRFHHAAGLFRLSFVMALNPQLILLSRLPVILLLLALNPSVLYLRFLPLYSRDNEDCRKDQNKIFNFGHHDKIKYYV